MAKGKKSKKAIEAEGEGEIGEMVEAMKNEADEPILIDTIIANPDALVIRSIMPGILVVMKCHIRGGRKTWREDVRETYEADGSQLKEAKVKSKTDSVEEVKFADALRSKVKRSVKKLAVETAIGLIVPAHKKQELAQTLLACHARINKHNEKARTLDLAYHYCLFNIEGNSAGPIAAVSEQLNLILQTVNDAVKDTDEKILSRATAHQLGDFKTAAAVLAAPIEQRIAVVAKIRADITRKAIAEARSFSTLLPEEAGIAVTDMVANIRKAAVTWVKASKESDDAYEKAINAVDIDGISAMQAALIKAATMAGSKAQEETALNAGPTAILDFDDEPEVHMGAMAGVALDLFKNGQGDESSNESPGAEPGSGTMAG